MINPDELYDADFSEEEVNGVLEGISIPPCPQIVVELLKETRRDDVDFSRISSLIIGDVALSVAVLKTANSPFFSLRRKAQSVQQAVAVLGLRNLLKIIYGLVLKKSVDIADPVEMTRFWDRSNYNAVVCAYLAARVGGVSTDNAYTFGLFHDAGLAILMQKFPDYKATLLLANAMPSGVTKIEDERHNTNHVTIGALLARNWYLPEPVVWAIRYHHDYSIFTSPSKHATSEVCGLVAVRLLSEHIVASFTNYPDDAEWAASKDVALSHLGWFDEDIDEMSKAINEDLREIQSDRGLP